jgi:hypothetical protein
MTQIVEGSLQRTALAGGGWEATYRVRRDDGAEVNVQGACSAQAFASAKQMNNTHALEQMRRLASFEVFDAAEHQVILERGGGIRFHFHDRDGHLEIHAT